MAKARIIILLVKSWENGRGAVQSIVKFSELTAPSSGLSFYLAN